MSKIAGKRWVAAHYKKSVHGRVVAEGDIEDEHQIEVRTFEEDVKPAIVSASAGGTVNLGNFSNFRIEVGVSIPCYAEEVVEAEARAWDLTKDELERRMDEIREIMGIQIRKTPQTPQAR